MTLTALRALTWTMVAGTVSCAFVLSTAQMTPARDAEPPGRLAATARSADAPATASPLKLVRAFLGRGAAVAQR